MHQISKLLHCCGALYHTEHFSTNINLPLMVVVSVTTPGSCCSERDIILTVYTPLVLPVMECSEVPVATVTLPVSAFPLVAS